MIQELVGGGIAAAERVVLIESPAKPFEPFRCSR
jgi:hypothetical protein